MEIKKIIEGFKEPGCYYRGAPFWAWNGKLEEKELRWQIRMMKQMGLGGFFMHSRVGLDTPYLSEEWFSYINACADEGEKLNMLAFLYDEDRWPSGAGGGIVTKNKKYRMRYLDMKILDDVNEIKNIKDVKGIFIADFEGPYIKEYRKVKKGEEIKLKKSEKILIFSIKIQKESDWYNGQTYLDTLNPDAVKEFIKVTHQQYKKYCGKYFGSTIPGIFTDEPNYGTSFFLEDNGIDTPWTEKLANVFKKKYGYDILNFLPEIYFNVVGEKISKVRYNYFDCITFLFTTSFSKQIGKWCEENNMLFTGHVLAEDTLISQTSVVGSCQRFYEYMQAPGMDLLTEYRKFSNTAKQVSSVARQFGRKWRLTETYGCTGWDFPFLGHKALGDWQVALGINLRFQHLSWYTMLGEAKRDYPASIFYQSPWWNLYKKVEDYFARINFIMTNGNEVRDLLVLHPIESMWAIYRNKNLIEKNLEKAEEVVEYDKMFEKLCESLLSLHVDFDYGDEEILSRWAKVKKGKETKIKVNKAEYKAVLVPPLYTIRNSTLKLLKEFKKEGGEVIFIKNFPEYIDGEKANFDFSSIFDIGENIEDGLKKIEKKARRISILDEKGKEIQPILYLLREDDDFYYLFLCNTSDEWKKEKFPPVRERNMKFDNVIIKGFPEFKYQPLEFDQENGNVYKCDINKTENGYEIKTNFAPLGSKLFLIPKKEISIECKKKEKLQEIERKEIKKDKWEIKLSEDNVLVLDMPYYKIGQERWNEKDEILRVDRKVRRYLGIKERGGAMVQPWVRKINKNPKSVDIHLKYEFFVDKIPSGELCICIEKPELYKIYINGYMLPEEMESGWWVDKSLRKINFDPSVLKLGKNEIILQTKYNENHPGLEIIYIKGEFGVKIEKNNDLRIVNKPEEIEIGDWTEKGIPFYSGNLTYMTKLKIENDNKRIFVRIPEYRGTALRIFVNGQQAGIIAWQPNEVEITEFLSKNDEEIILGIEVIGSRRNSHGPFHWFEKWSEWTGPGQFTPGEKEYYNGYQIVPSGLLKTPEIVFYQEI